MADPHERDRGSKSRVARAVRAAAEQLGNTPAVCRRSYLHPAVIEGYVAGELPPEPEEDEVEEGSGLRPEEELVLDFLEEHEAEASAE